jgi:hypothetical protein
MGDIKIPDSVRKNLLENEEVVGKISITRGPDFYATDKRLIKRRRSAVGEALVGVLAPKAHVLSVEYSRIDSITFHRYRPLPMVIAGIVLGSIMIGASVLFFSLPAPNPEYYRGPDPRLFLGGFFIVVGILLMILLCGFRWSHYQLNVRGADDQELKEWRIVRPPLSWRKKRIDNFVSVVRDRMSQRS